MVPLEYLQLPLVSVSVITVGKSANMLNTWVLLGVLVVIFIYLFIGAVLAESAKEAAPAKEDIGNGELGCFTLFVFFLWLPMTIKYMLFGRQDEDE